MVQVGSTILVIGTDFYGVVLSEHPLVRRYFKTRVWNPRTGSYEEKEYAALSLKEVYNPLIQKLSNVDDALGDRSFREFAIDKALETKDWEWLKELSNAKETI